MTGRKLAPICRTLGISRACAYRESVGRPARYVRADDRIVMAQIRAVIRTRASYGARRVRALVNREFATGYNLKRIQRVMELNGWKLPRATRRRTGRSSCRAGSRTTTPSRPTRRSAFSHPSSTAGPGWWPVRNASPNCLTKRGTQQT
jgi:hypothetical protein